MNRPVKGLVVAHGSLAAGLAGAARQITGVDEEGLQALSNDGQGPDGLISAIEQAAGDAPVIIFTDLASGSCAFAAKKVGKTRGETGIVTGVNLTVLVDFVFHRDLPVAELVDRLAQSGRSSIVATCTVEAADADRPAPR